MGKGAFIKSMDRTGKKSAFIKRMDSCSQKLQFKHNNGKNSGKGIGLRIMNFQG